MPGWGKRRSMGPVCLLIVGVAAGTAFAQDRLSDEVLQSADYTRGRLAFQQRCSACHTLANRGSNLAGPNLWGVVNNPAGSKDGFAYSAALSRAEFDWTPDRIAAFIADPAASVVGTTMMIPEGVPEADRVPMISFIMVETGAAGWPRPEPELAESDVDPDAPISERYASFWNHMMKNTTRYRLVNGGDEIVFDAYFNTDGSVSANNESIRGFWRVDERDFFCYALYGIPMAPFEFVECFPIVAMSIPRFAEELWQSNPVGDVTLHGGILPGRPGAL